MKHYLRHENKVNENKLVLSRKVLRCETTKQLFSFMWNLQTYINFKLDL